jgi:hypothetical protein
MPSWGEILKEQVEIAKKLGKPNLDIVRRKYLKQLHDYTKRNTVLYATAWTQKPVPPQFLSITDEDIQGFMEVIHGLTGDQLDIVLHSPGGSPVATEALVTYLRTKFNHIRVIIPYGAMSAATMLACSSNEVLMGNHSFIGPIDPQMVIPTRFGPQSIPAQAILEQFNRAKKECKEDLKNLGVWMPMLEQYGPALLKQCENASELSTALVAKWLATYMFKGIKDGKNKAKEIAAKLSAHSQHKSHGRHIGLKETLKLGLNVMKLEDDPVLQDLVLSVFHSTTQTFDATPAVKIVENHLYSAFIKRVSPIQYVPKPVPKPKKK